jgi:hypothetical protein
VKPSLVCRKVALKVPGWPSAGGGFTRFGMSSQFGVAEFAKTSACTVPKTFTGNFDVDSTLVWASSATCALRSSTVAESCAVAAAADGGAVSRAAFSAATSARSCCSSARIAASSCLTSTLS